MKKIAPSLLAFAFLHIAYGDSLAAVWVNTTPGALVKQIEIYNSNTGPVGVGDNPLLPTEGYVNITFQNDVVYPGLPLHPTASSASPSFVLVDNNYTLYTVYYCQPGSGSPVTNNICDGIALRVQNEQLCAGFFQYTTLVDRVVAIADIGCFTLSGITRPLVKRDFFQKYTKEQLIDILTGVKPPIGPICLTCPPWDGYAKDIDLKLKGLQIKKYKIEAKELK